jgi:hypothetical protein
LNPFDQPADPLGDVETFREDFNLSGVRKPKIERPGFVDWTGGLITEPGAYVGFPIQRYHGAECCAGPSISSTGLKRLVGEKGQRTKGKTPRHFWERSNLNPNRQPEDSDALRLGRAFHDALLQPEFWRGPESVYHHLPDGFSRAKSKAMAVEIAEADAALAAGKCCMSADEAALTDAMVEAARADPLFAALLGKGEPEVTFAWQDKETGVWCRARPDFVLANRAFALNVKTDTDASFDGFSKSIAKYGYAQSAALELDGYAAIFGEAPATFLHPVIEKPTLSAWEPGSYIATAVWELPAEDIERGRWLNRQALRTFADCLAKGRWDGYTPDPEPCGLPGWARKLIDDGGQFEDHDDNLKGDDK